MLKEYDKKRDFSRTPEPPTERTEAGGGPLIFVIQMHAARRRLRAQDIPPHLGVWWRELRYEALAELRADPRVESRERLRQATAREHVAGYKVPRELHIVDEIPRAPSGKPAYTRAKEIALSGDFLIS